MLFDSENIKNDTLDGVLTYCVMSQFSKDACGGLSAIRLWRSVPTKRRDVMLQDVARYAPVASPAWLVEATEGLIRRY